MTGTLALVKIFAIASLAASGLFVFSAQYDTGESEGLSSRTGATSGAESEAQISTEGDEASTTAEADVNAQSQTTFDCRDNCSAPCAAACANLQRPPLDGAVDDEVVAFGAAAAPEQPCLCAEGDATTNLSVGTETSAQTGSVTAESGASAEGFAALSVGGQ